MLWFPWYRRPHRGSSKHYVINVQELSGYVKPFRMKKRGGNIHDSLFYNQINLSLLSAFLSTLTTKIKGPCVKCLEEDAGRLLKIFLKRVCRTKILMPQQQI